MTTLTVTSEQTARGQPATVRVEPVATASASKDAAPRRAPFFLPADQSYFWTAAWQQGEAEALREIEAGDVKRFTSASGAVAWLLSDADE